jgi:hypothetical protein
VAALYQGRHEGAALVVGYAPSVRADVAAARALRPAAVLLGVKYAAVLYQEIEHVWTQHIEQAADIRARAGRRIFIHSRGRLYQGRRYQRVNESDVDYLWPQLRWAAGGSGIVAALWARHGMGFSEAILCGCPLEPGGYVEDIQCFKQPRGAEGSFVDPRPLERWRASVREFVSNGRAAGITSMSGWTRATLGAPA